MVSQLMEESALGSGYIKTCIAYFLRRPELSKLRPKDIHSISIAKIFTHAAGSDLVHELIEL